jgi:hypothetical protein
MTHPSPADAEKINDWASRTTGRVINRVVDEEEPLKAPVFVTALTAIKGAPPPGSGVSWGRRGLTVPMCRAANWTRPFDAFHTWPAEFIDDNGVGTTCQMMHQRGNLTVRHPITRRAGC